MRPAIRHDLALLIGRVALGVIFVAHGWQKLNDWGISTVQANFAQMDVPLPDLAAYFATFVELGGGIALIVGAATPIVGALLAANMAGAFFVVHVSNGLFVGNGGYELVLALGAGALAIALLGAGRFSVDSLATAAYAKKREPATVAA